MLIAVPTGLEFTLLVERMFSRGAIGILVPQHVTSEGYLPKRLMSQAPVPLPVISVHAELLPKLAGRPVRASIPFHTSVVQAGNVTARLQGTDPALDTVPLIVGAHFNGGQ